MREIEKRIKEVKDINEYENLSKLARILRLWTQKDISHSFKLPWIIFYCQMQELIDIIVIMREKKDHEILIDLEKLIGKSINDYIEVAEDISRAEIWIKDIVDILLWEIDKNWKRNTVEYKEKNNANEIRNRLDNYIESLCVYKNDDKERNKRKYSDFLYEVINHIRKTYNNWKENLFTCYDYKYLPNTNLELELFNSRMKRLHRKITGLKSSQKYIKIHWEQMPYCVVVDYSYDNIINLLKWVNHEQIKLRCKQEKEKSKLRWRDQKTIKNLWEVLKEISIEWGN